MRKHFTKCFIFGNLPLSSNNNECACTAISLVQVQSSRFWSTTFMTVYYYTGPKLRVQLLTLPRRKEIFHGNNYGVSVEEVRASPAASSGCNLCKCDPGRNEETPTPTRRFTTPSINWQVRSWWCLLKILLFTFSFNRFSRFNSKKIVGKRVKSEKRSDKEKH